jgi:hypothetical protein
MKNTYSIIGLSMILLLALAACSKDEYKDFYTGGTAPVLTMATNTGADSVSMSYADSGRTALALAWTNPEYKFTTGVSSQNVNYQVQVDQAGGGFASGSTAVISLSEDLGDTLTEAKLNDIMLNQLGLKDSVSYQMEIRVLSAVGTNAAIPLASNVTTFTAVPYAIPPKVPPPTTGELYITGSATAKGWMVGGDVSSVAGQQFTKLSPTEYVITIQLIGPAQEYLFVPAAGDWTNKYGCSDEASQGLDGGAFGFNFSKNFPGPATSGTYKIDVNFQRGLYTVTPQ